jgi:hypothetical protein
MSLYALGIYTMLSTPNMFTEPHKEPIPKQDDVVHIARTLSPSTTTAVTRTTTGILNNNSNLM